MRQRLGEGRGGKECREDGDENANYADDGGWKRSAWVRRRGVLRGEKFGVDEIVALDGLRGNYGNGAGEHGAAEGEGVELAALATGIDFGRQVAEERRVEGAAGERRAEGARVDTGEMRAQAGCDHLAGEFGGGDAEIRTPDREDGFEAGSFEQADAVGANVLEEEVSEGDAVEAFGDSTGANGGHARLEVGVGAGEGQVDLPEGQTRGFGLPVEQLLAVAVDGDAAEFLVDRGEESDDLVLWLLAKEMKRPGAVFSSAPTKQDALRSGA